MEIGYCLTEQETQELLKIIHKESIEPHYEGASLHIEELTYIVYQIEYSFYYGIGYGDSLPMVEVKNIIE